MMKLSDFCEVPPRDAHVYRMSGGQWCLREYTKGHLNAGTWRETDITAEQAQIVLEAQRDS